MGSGYSKQKKAFKQQFAAMEAKMKETLVEGSSGNGLVQLTLNGDYEIVKLKIKPECVDPEDVEGLEDLIKAAFNDAAKKLKDSMPGMGGLGGMPF